MSYGCLIIDSNESNYFMKYVCATEKNFKSWISQHFSPPGMSRSSSNKNSLIPPTPPRSRPPPTPPRNIPPPTPPRYIPPPTPPRSGGRRVASNKSAMPPPSRAPPEAPSAQEEAMDQVPHNGVDQEGEPEDDDTLVSKILLFCFQ